MNNNQLKSLTDKIRQTFENIYQQRMADVPVCNNKIKVSILDLQYWNDNILGILITPWFMNLMLLPVDSDNWDEKNELETEIHIFPSGKYQFITAFEEDIGKYQSCSIFSPMFEFSDNNAAIETAKAVMNELMNAENIDTTSTYADRIEKIWHGEDEIENICQLSNIDTELDDTKDSKIECNEKHKNKVTISRRNLLRGELSIDKISINESQSIKTIGN